MKSFLACMFLALSLACAHAADLGASAVEVVLASGGHGSGVYLGGNYVLTAGHVVKDEATVTVKKPRAGSWVDSWTADVLWVDAAQDFALLRVKAVLPESLEKSSLNCTEPKPQQDVIIAGWPRSMGFVVTRGYVAAGDDANAKRGDWPHTFIVVAPITFGNSGGPVYDTDGKVIGLAVGILNGTSLGLAVPVYLVCKVLPKLE